MQTVRGELQQTVQLLCQNLSEKLDSNLVSLTLVGSAVTDDFVAGKSDLNSVLVVNAIDASVLSVLAAMGRPMGRKRLRAPLLMTPAYIERSCDVFAVEWLDYQAFHQTVHGDDPFVSLAFEPEHVRLQCEKQFKSVLINLRQGYISSAEKNDVIERLIVGAAKELLIYLRAMLWLEGVDRSGGYQETCDGIQRCFSLDMNPLKTAFDFRYKKLPYHSGQIKPLFTDAYQAIESLSKLTDEWGA